MQIKNHEFRSIIYMIEQTRDLIIKHGWCHSKELTVKEGKIDLQAALCGLDLGPVIKGLPAETAYVKTRNWLNHLLHPSNMMEFNDRPGNTQSNVIAFLDYAVDELRGIG